jgi:phosphate uptake regulator
LGVKLESRKLISFGSSSYVISIPKAWVRKNKLEKGSPIYLSEKPDGLIISPSTESKKQTKETQIDVSNKSIDRIKAEIVASYLNNYDIIEIRNAKEEDMQQIKGILRDLAGLEIMEQTQTKIVVKDLINIKEVSIKTLIRRIDIIIRSMFDDLIAGSHGKMGSLLKSFYQRDIDINRLYYLVRRVMTAALEDPTIRRMLETNSIELVFDWEIALRLEKIGDQLKRMAKRMNEVKLENRPNKYIDCILGELCATYLDIMKAYYSKDKNIAFNVELKNVSRVQNCDDLLEHLEKNRDMDMHEIDNLVILTEKFKDMSASIKNIARVVIDNGMTVHKP